MKRLSLVLMSVALMLGMAQCKKNVETVSEGIGNQNFTDGEIRLMVNDGKLAVFPATGAVYYTAGDVIYVASGGTYRGTMTYTVSDDGGYFSGTLTSTPSNGATLYFYYLGGKTPSESVGAGTLTVNISDQTTSYPVIAYGEATEKYGTTSTYHATLKNVGALVKFDVNSYSSTVATCIKGMYNQVSFALSSSNVGTPTPSQVDNGRIKLPAGSGERWAVLLPNASAVSASTAYMSDMGYSVTQNNVPVIKENDYISSGIGVTVTRMEGVLPGEFTINASGDKVHFSQGNLQYQASTGTWRFAAQQYTFIGDAAGNTTSDLATRATQSDWIDMFPWGTSGWEGSGAICYQPYSISNVNTNYYVGGSYINNLEGDYANADWGVYNAISNGGNKAGMWRTLRNEEISYILHSRSGVATRFAKATVNSVKGLILFPDSYTHPSDLTALTNVNNAGAASSVNTYTAADWALMEGAGAVFFPGAGLINSSGYNDYDTGAGMRIWTAATAYSNGNPSEDYEKAICFNSTESKATFVVSNRTMRLCVRLVCEE